MSDERTFEATPSRLRRARREGDVPRAAELGASVALLAGGAALTGVVPFAADAFRSIATSRGGYATLALCALAPACASACAGAVVSLAQNGGLRFAAPAWKAERLSPVAGFKRMFSRDAFAQALRACAALAVAFVAAGFAIVHAIAPAAVRGETFGLAHAAWSAAVRVGAVAATTGCAFGALEFFAARRAWLRRLRMTFADFKRDAKEQDGDPQVRSRRRALHRSLSRGDVRRVEEAAFVLCNPTHVAIALAYAPPADPVPRVLVAAADEVAARVRELARAAGVPLVEQPELARALFAGAEIGAPIPHEHYVAVAEIVVALTRAGAL